MQTTYGLGSGLHSSARGSNLAGAGLDQQQLASSLLGQAAGMETQRNASNERREAADKAGKVQLAASVGSAAGGVWAGAAYGSAAGPWGALAGGLVGALAGNLF